MKKIHLVLLVLAILLVFMYLVKKQKKTVSFADSPVYIPEIPEEYLNKEIDKYSGEWLNMPGNLV